MGSRCWLKAPILSKNYSFIIIVPPTKATTQQRKNILTCSANSIDMFATRTKKCNNILLSVCGSMKKLIQNSSLSSRVRTGLQFSIKCIVISIYRFFNMLTLYTISQFCLTNSLFSSAYALGNFNFWELYNETLISYYHTIYHHIVHRRGKGCMWKSNHC